MHITIRQEQQADYTETEKLIQQAFLTEVHSDHLEHILVRKLRHTSAFIPELSLVACTASGALIGHILLSKITIINTETAIPSLALAPICVAPTYQNKGIGRQLIEAAIQRAKSLGYLSVIVLGHAEYYPKFGFKCASTWQIKAPFDVPDALFQALELTEHALQNVSGTVQYSEAFNL